MAFSLKDRVKETTTTTGTGSISMGGAVTGFRAFSAAFSTGDTTYYTIDGGSGEWEVGLGTLTSGTPWTMARTSVLASSNSGSAVDFSAGTKNVWCDAPAVMVSPGGSSGQVQYNNAGAFGGVTGITLATGTLSALAITGGTVTSSTPVLDATQTWNSGGTTFTGLKLNVTDTASASGSLLMDLQVGGGSKFSVRKDGQIYSNGGIYQFYTSGLTVGFFSASQTAGGAGTPSQAMPIVTAYTSCYSLTGTRGGIFGRLNSGGSVELNSSGQIIFSSSSDAAAGGDTYLARDAANTLALRNSTNAQTFNVYNTYTDASNYERGFIKFETNLLKIGTENAGTGSGRTIQIISAGGGIGLFQGGTNTWNFNNSGHFVAGTDNTYDIGASGATRPRNIYAGGAVLTAGNIWCGFDLVMNNSSRSIYWTASTVLAAPSNGVLRLSNNAATDFNRLQFGGTTSSFPALKRSSAALQTRLADDSDYAEHAAAYFNSAKAYTVATLPTGTVGFIARVTDASAPTVGSTVAGGGAAAALVWFNGSNYTVIGV